MPVETPPLVDMRDIIRLSGQAAYDRGREYSRSGMVSEVDWDPDSGLLSSTVRGSGLNVYRCHLELAPARDGYHKPVSGNCSCPMVFDCKHVAATLLECNRIHLQQNGEGALQRGSDLSTTSVTIAEPDWKKTLGSITRSAPAPAAPFGSRMPPAVSPIGLQFELREQTPRTRDRWRGPTAQTSIGWSNGENRLGVRPVIRSGAGNWVRGTITWNSIGYQSHRLALEETHQRWFAQLAALHKATTRDVYTGQDTDWLYLDDFHSTLLWRLLDEAAMLGIELLGSKKGGVVRIGREARIGLDVSAGSLDSESTPGEHPGDLKLRTTLEIDGDNFAPDHAGSIGNHGVYIAEFTPAAVYTLAPSAVPLTEEHRRLLGRGPVLEIPASDAEEFLTEYYPRLNRTIEVTSADATVQLPEIVPPTLVLTATFTAKQTLKLEWAWEYQSGAGVVRKPVHPLGALAATTDDLRDVATEQVVLGAAMSLLSSTPEAAGIPVLTSTTLQGLPAAEFSSVVIALVQELPGVRVDLVGERPDYQELTDIPHLVVTTVETTHRDWFDLGVLVSVDGRKVPFGPLFKALSKGAKKLLLVDNSYLSLDQPVFDELKRLIDEASALSEWETGPRISRYQASLWADFEDLADETEQAQSWRDAVSALASLEAVEVTPLPSSLDADLRPYQLDGFHWLAFLWRHGLGGILADDMGLGKTLQTLALVGHAVEARLADQAPDAAPAAPFLVVAPTSVVSNWLAEAARFVPSLAVRGISATESKSGTRVADTARGADIVVTSYALFRLDFESYQAEKWAGLVLDEAQFVKNAASKAHQCAVELAAPFKLAITGTPMENSLEDLWALFSITAPGLFPSARRFSEEYIKPITNGGSPKAQLETEEVAEPRVVRFVDEDETPVPRPGTSTQVTAAITPTTLTSAELVAKLRRRIRPLMMRRTKELVATELPAKQEQVLQIDLSPRHRTLYDTFLQKERQKLLGLLDDMNKNRFIVFRSLTLLRMLSLDASLVDDKYADIPSSKLDALFEQLDDVVAEGHRALIFSQFTSFLKKAAERLDAVGIPTPTSTARPGSARRSSRASKRAPRRCS